MACEAMSRDCKQQQSKHLCMQPGALGNSWSHSCCTAWRLNNSSPSSSVLGFALEAKVQSTNISWSLRACSQLPSLSVNGSILAATAAAAGERFCLTVKWCLAGVNSRRVDLQAWHAVGVPAVWSLTALKGQRYRADVQKRQNAEMLTLATERHCPAPKHRLRYLSLAKAFKKFSFSSR